MDQSFQKDFILSDIYAHIEIKITSGVQDQTEGSFGILDAFDRGNAKAEAYQKLYDMTKKHKSGIGAQDLFNPDDIEAMLQRKAVTLVPPVSVKLHLRNNCPRIQGRFYISREAAYIWYSIFVTNKDFPLDLFHEINKR
ncbi:hypothetical protein HPB48_004823 [Haemaphysalis longicornis]|uniref:Uncharacterized protein n=1 Tax=Haemaphysalis longicornis TaxID=44386 RepID=A0A9J6GLY8_HAELO|nr:hypothetical protein HPB48_004823 [Haemaphysalis longicornis]